MQPIPAGALVVAVRGDHDRLNDAQQAADFLRRYPDWQRYGLSAYYATSEEAIDRLASSELERFPVLLIYDVAILAAHGIETVPTFRNPHVTLAFRELTVGLAALLAAKHERRANRYHDAHEGGAHERGTAH